MAPDPEHREGCLLLLGLDPGRGYSIEELVAARDAKLEANRAEPSGSASYVEAIDDVFESLARECESRTDDTGAKIESESAGPMGPSEHDLAPSAFPPPLPSPMQPTAFQASLPVLQCRRIVTGADDYWFEETGWYRPYQNRSVDHRPALQVPAARHSLVAPTVFWTLCIIVADLILHAGHDRAVVYGYSIGLIVLGICGVARYIAVHGARQVSTWLGVVLLVVAGLATVPAAYCVASLPSMIRSVLGRRGDPWYCQRG